MVHAGGGVTYGSQSRVRDCSSLSASHRVTRGPHAGNTSDNQTHTYCVQLYSVNLLDTQIFKTC